MRTEKKRGKMYGREITKRKCYDKPRNYLPIFSTNFALIFRF